MKTQEKKIGTNDESFEVRAEELAGQIIRNSTTSILLNLRFLESALFRLEPTAAKTTFATNGEKLYYGFDFLFRTYKDESAFVTRGILHVLMHCIFRHPFVADTVDSELWDLATDIAVEAAIEDLGIQTLNTRRTPQQKKALGELRSQVSILSAEKLYQFFCGCPKSRRTFLALADLFAVCDHSVWYAPEEQMGNETESGGADSENRPDSHSGGSNSDGKGKEKPQEQGCSADSRDEADEESENGDTGTGSSELDSGEGNSPSAGSGQEDTVADHMPRSTQAPAALSPSQRSQANDTWEDISRHVQMDMETFSQQPGNVAGNLVQQLQTLNRERYDYRTFLKRFATRREVMKINDDEFDYIFYMYGLKLYEKMPLIEPLEYKEEQRIRDFVIVIDTSGSTAGELVQTFLQKTYNILQSTETFDSRINLYIIQADCTIQDVRKISSVDEFNAYVQNLQIFGQGGTDFRPAFKYVDELVASGDLTHLKGLIYFTDGYGTFPQYKPNYDAAFVFVEEGFYEEPQVPPWAIKMVLDEEEIPQI